MQSQELEKNNGEKKITNFFYNGATCLNLAVSIARCASHVPDRVPTSRCCYTRCTQVIRYKVVFSLLCVLFSLFILSFSPFSIFFVHRYFLSRIQERVRRGLIIIPATASVTRPPFFFILPFFSGGKGGGSSVIYLD